MSLKQMTRLALLSSLCVALRYAFASLPNVQPITAIFLIASFVFSLRESLLLMAITILISSFLLGFGPWVPLQILSFAVIIVLWRFLLYPLTEHLNFDKMVVLALQTLLAGSLGVVYGVVIDSINAFIYNMPWWTYVLAGASFNLAHALSTAFFYPLLLPILRRFSQNETLS